MVALIQIIRTSLPVPRHLAPITRNMDIIALDRFDQRRTTLTLGKMVQSLSRPIVSYNMFLFQINVLFDLIYQEQIKSMYQSLVFLIQKLIMLQYLVVNGRLHSSPKRNDFR